MRFVQATLCLVIDEARKMILLGYKKRGFGMGKLAGFGGKVLPSETTQQAALRELEEECGLWVDGGLQESGQVVFLFRVKPEWNQLVHVFRTYSWKGEVTESHEMRPVWISITEIPYHTMWMDNRYWMPLAIGGMPFRGVFEFGDDNETVQAWRLSNGWLEPDQIQLGLE